MDGYDEDNQIFFIVCMQVLMSALNVFSMRPLHCHPRVASALLDAFLFRNLYKYYSILLVHF